MKKMWLMLVAALLCAVLLVGCGGSQPEGAPAPENSVSEESTPSAAGELYDTGSFQVEVAAAWTAFPVSDLFSEEEDAIDPTALSICKDATSDWSTLTNPNLRIDYYGPDTAMMQPDSSWYDDAADLEPIELDNYTWNGFTAVSMDYPMAILWAEDGDHQFQVSVWLEMDNGAITLEDADLLAMLGSIRPTL